jgi:MFS family permease
LKIGESFLFCTNSLERRSFLFGYDSGVMTDVIASPDFLEFFDTEPTSPIIGAINATFSGGAVFGALFGGVIMDKYGRKGTIFVGAVIASVGAVLQCAAYQYVLINPLPPFWVSRVVAFI